MSGEKHTALTAKEAAGRLDGAEYGEEGSAELWAEMKVAGLVAVFGASDDLMEFRGAIDDEVGAYDGTTAFVTGTGLFEPCRCDCKFSREAQKQAAAIDALWCYENGFSWVYETDLPHEVFVVREGGDNYCRGIVFSLSDLAKAKSPQVEG